MAKKCNKTEHNWIKWELRWDAKEGKVWIKWCPNCGIEEKSQYAPPPESTVEEIARWLSSQILSKKRIC
ncbi:MAG: hypothetical protein A3A08_01915 [Candidatus Nealsonbacteria bacterium RIFCSPLOWO2_01_FULL_41_9]|uniref:Uncharacterized protein n=1 Tax=Candidatus Nealsonbacteria bacterium RIFCSPLOWO2_01_FULL_41_9 TaxID=1801671 RepID=A0A1G2EDS7_9BACT|nr:MAG: hypothetical protein A3A08_01915 [Candidatus Nealsonbacteria bacterium RIFCSPLOWO2_01_FULL_41_9]